MAHLSPFDLLQRQFADNLINISHGYPNLFHGVQLTQRNGAVIEGPEVHRNGKGDPDLVGPGVPFPDGLSGVIDLAADQSALQ